MNVSNAWDISTGSKDVLVAIIDSGIDWFHPDLRNNIYINPDESYTSIDWQNGVITGDGQDNDNNGKTDDILGWDFENNTKNPIHIDADNFAQGYGHGTTVASQVGAVGDNGINAVGMAWNVSLLGLKVKGPDLEAWLVKTISAIDYCIDMDVDIINMSLGTTQWEEEDLFHQKIQQAYNNYNILITSIAQNDGQDLKNYPGAWSEVMAMAATSLNDKRDQYSNYGTWVECTATVEDQGWLDYYYQTQTHYASIKDGQTSHAAPLVAGLAVLIKTINSNLTNVQIREIINTTCDNIDDANLYDPSYGKLGSGRINAYEALKYTLENYGGTLSGDVTLTEDLTIASGKLLTIESGTTVSFATGKKLIINGRIVAEDATFQPESGTWNGILINGSSSSSFENCRIEGIANSAYGLTLGGTNGVEHHVDDCYIEGGYAAVWIKGSSDPIINNSYLKATGARDVVLSSNNSEGIIKDCKLYAENYQVIRGHKNTDSASPSYGAPNGLNIIDGTYFTTEGSSIYVSGGYPYFNYGYNVVPSDYYLYQYSNYSGSARYAYNNYWGGGAPVVQGNTVYYSGYTGSPNPNAGPDWSLSKSSGIEQQVEDYDDFFIAWDMYHDKDFEGTKEAAKQLFQTKRTEEQSCEALFLWMKSALRDGTLKEEKDKLISINKDLSVNESARYEAMRWLAKLAVMNGDFKKAEDYAASIPTSSLMGREIYFDIASEIMDKWADLDRTFAVLDKLTQRYNDEETLEEKQFVTQLYSENLEAFTNSGWIAPNPEQTGDEFVAPNLSIAYPNPFNPITHIQFNLPEDADVKLVVYNIQGKEIRELVNGFKTAGSYTVDFDGTSLASGVYFYKIDISNLKGKFTNVKRMVLVK